jgi:NAD+ kinase
VKASHLDRRKPKSFVLVTNATTEADAAANRLRTRYGEASLDSADIVVALGGDGLVLKTLHRVTRNGLQIWCSTN